jgi:DNA-binding LacI/PurR family transcriptional regulator
LSGNDRLAGYQSALANYDIAPRSDYIIHNDYLNHSLRRAFVYWMSLPHDQQPTALIAVSDSVAAEAMRTAEQFGLRVGDNLALVGFDDAPFVSYLRPTLSTLRQPLDRICQQLVDLLDQRIKGAGQPYINRLITPELIVRQSSCPAPNVL